MQNFGTLRKKFNLPPFFPQICDSAGVGGVPDFFVIGILTFLLLRSPCKNLEPYDNSFWDFNNGGKSMSKRWIIPKIVAYLSLLRWSHALRSDQLLLCHRQPGWFWLFFSGFLLEQHSWWFHHFHFIWKFSCLQLRVYQHPINHNLIGSPPPNLAHYLRTRMIRGQFMLV